MQINSIGGYYAPKANFSNTSKPVSFGISNPYPPDLVKDGTIVFEDRDGNPYAYENYDPEKDKDIFEFDSAPKNPIKAPSMDSDGISKANDQIIMNGTGFNSLF